MNRIIPLCFLLLSSILSAQQTVSDSLFRIDNLEIHFDFASNELDSTAIAAITSLYINNHKKNCDSIYITAHTDNVGDKERNMALSLERASIVKTKLLSLGIPDSILQVEEFGESRPVASNSTERGRRLNRRSTIEVYKKIKMTTLKGKIVNRNTKEGIFGTVEVGSAIINGSIITSEAGEFSAKIPVGAVIKLRPNAYGYMMAKDTIFRPKRPTNIYVKLFLRPLPQKKSDTTSVVLLKGQLVDSLDEHSLIGKLEISFENQIKSIETNEKGEFKVILPVGKVVNIESVVRDYKPNIYSITPSLALIKDQQIIKLTPIKKGDAIALENLLFYTDQSKLIPKSEVELEKLLYFMQINSTIKVEIAGHVDNTNKAPLPEDDILFRLSISRAKMIYEHLIKNGITENRLQYKGYGNHEPIHKMPLTVEEHTANRRVEIRILNED